MKKPAGIVEQVYQSRVLRDKAHEAHKAYDKARERHERAEQAWRDIPILDEDPTPDSDKKNMEGYTAVKEARRTMNEACEAMAEAYCDYVNHKRSIRSEK